MTVYRPSARVKLVIRTEEYDDTADLDARVSDNTPDTPYERGETVNAPRSTTTSIDDQPTEALARNRERRLALERARAAMAQEDYEEQLRQVNDEREQILRGNSGSNDDDVGTPPEAISGRRDDRTVVGNILPQSVQIERNGLASADTATIEIDYIDAPIDPRIIRAASVEILIGVIRAEDYEDGVERGARRSDRSLTSVAGANDEGILEGTTRYVGYVDEWSISYGDKGDTITLECRDMSAPLRDIKLPEGVSINLDLPIDEGITSFINECTTTRGVNVIYGGPAPTPTPSNNSSTRRRARRGRIARRSRRSNSDMTMWDHITDVVRGLGLVPIVRGYDIVIIEPRTLYTTQGVTRMVFGRNLESLEFSRRLMGDKVPTIEVRSYDPDLGRTLWGRYPTKSGEQASGILGGEQPRRRRRRRRANNVTPSGSNPSEQIKVMSVSGVTDHAVLINIARNAYEQIGRQEIEGSFSTFDAWSYDMDPDSADLLDLSSGDSVELLIAQNTTNDEEIGSNATLSRIQAMDRERRTNYMVSIGWPRSVAARFAALQDATGFETVFRVNDVRMAWSCDDGLRIQVGFINYITVREENPE